jgi:hypothetical protein
MHARATRGLKSRLGRATALRGAPPELSEKDSMACTRKLAQGIEHMQNYHPVFISHLDQDFKVCCLLSVSLFLDSLLTSRMSVLDISPTF